MEVGKAERDWLELVADLLATPLTRLPDERIALQLCETFDLTGCSYNDLPAGSPDPAVLRLWPFDEKFGGHRGELLEWTEQRAHLAHPLLLFYLHTGSRVPVQTVDVPRWIADPDGEWSELAKPAASTHQLSLPLRLGPGTHRAFVMGRSEAFRPDEARLASLLWRLLTGLDRQVEANNTTSPEPEAAADLRLTPRELAVLGLLADGLTAAAIGHRLAIRERTVHKHLEHTYAKLGVADRLSAVLRAQHLGLLPRPEEAQLYVARGG
ncbi:helix-turn-helix transcriptional regulator [Pseudonocardia nigra]|uniref:helix-turn-helix transcriptional regulator n=1 Tax=Pseudonocardia nigra TaxID=1921578 RepID=UPI001C5CCCB1|nr:LuxR C-terminal-related transcriptional regulator [Pseudonocardia nigra]